MNISSGESVGGFFDNKYLIGVIMVIINLGARFIVNELNEDQRNMINSKYLRRILIFLVIFMATRDIVITIILSVVVILFVFEFFNSDSEYSLVPKKEKVLKNNNKNDNKNEKLDKIINELNEIKGSM